MIENKPCLVTHVGYIIAIIIILVVSLFTIDAQNAHINKIEASQPIVYEECLDGVLHQAQNFSGLVVYNSKFEECGR